MKKLIHDAIKITNDNVILAIPLVIFMWLIGAYIGYSKFSADSILELTIAVVTILFMLGAFFSGWFYMIKEAVRLSKKIFVIDKDRTKAALELYKEFPAGIGKYFLTFIGIAIIFVTLFTLAAAALFKLGLILIGNVDFSPLQMKQALGTPDDMRLFIESLSEAQLIKLSKWNLLFMLGSAIISYITILWIPEVINGERNPAIALFKSIKKVIKKPLKTFGLFLFIGIFNFILSFLSTFAIYNPITYLIMMVAYFYFLVFIVVLLFLYYEKEYLLKPEENNITLTDDKTDTEE